MQDLDIPLKLLLSFVIGGVIGLEREINEKKDITGDKQRLPVAVLGLRSFSLIAGLGAISGILFKDFLLISVLITSLAGVFITAFYILDTLDTKDYGITTELSLIYAYLIGFLILINIIPIQLIIALTVILVLLMSRKEKIKDIVEDIKKQEINAFASYAVLAFVILPFLPNSTYSISDFKGLEDFIQNIGLNMSGFKDVEIFNPFKLWLIVVLITGVDVIGYVLERTVGKKGWFLTSAAGGFVSSTAATISLAKQSKGSKNINTFLSAALIANLISFLPILIILSSLNSALLVKALPIFLTIIFVMILLTGFFYRASLKEKPAKTYSDQPEHKIFDLTSALKFAGLFLTVNIISKIALELFGNNGFLITSAIGSLPGIDAVVINIAQLAGEKVNMELAMWALVIANGINLLAKSFYSFIQGDKTFGLKFLICMGLVIAASIAANLIF